MQEKLIKEYLKNKLAKDSLTKKPNCPDSQALLAYLSKSLNQKQQKDIESHLCQCGFCLNQLSIAQETLKRNKKNKFGPIPQKLISKTKIALGINKTTQKRKNAKKNLFLATTVIFFILSFLIPRYFIQFLVGSLIVGIRWSFESKGGQTLIMILDSWRRQSHDKDEQISNRLKDHFKN